jgi:hypothetical protein
MSMMLARGVDVVHGKRVNLDLRYFKKLEEGVMREGKLIFFSEFQKLYASIVIFKSL